MLKYEQLVKAKELEIEGLSMLRQARDLSAGKVEEMEEKESFQFDQTSVKQRLQEIKDKLGQGVFKTLGSKILDRLSRVLDAILGDDSLFAKVKSDESLNNLSVQGKPAMFDKETLESAVSGLYSKLFPSMQHAYASLIEELDKVAQELEDAGDDDLKKIASEIDVISNTLEQEQE